MMNIVLTGAANGIGRELAEHYSLGNNLYIIDNDKEGLEKIFYRHPSIYPVVADLSNIQSIKNAVKKISEKSDNHVDVLINLASVITRSNFIDVSVDEWNYVNDVNVKGTFFLTQEILKLMIPRNSGKIISFSSVAGFFLHKSSNQFPYILSKSAIMLINRQIALEFAENGILANTIILGNTEIGMVKSGRNEDEYINFIENAKRMTPLNRMVSKKGIIETVDFLINSDDITGTEIVLDAGYLAMRSTTLI